MVVFVEGEGVGEFFSALRASYAFVVAVFVGYAVKFIFVVFNLCGMDILIIMLIMVVFVMVIFRCFGVFVGLGEVFAMFVM